MPVENVIEVDLAKVLNANVKPKTIRWRGPHALKVGLEIDKKVYEVFDQDPLAYAKVRDPISNRYKEFLSKAERLYKTCDSDVGRNKGKPAEIKKAVAAFEKGLGTELKKLHKDVPKIADTEWNKIKKTKSEYAKYKLRGFLTALLDIVGVVLSAIGVGSAAATGGLSLLIGLHGMAKSLNGLYKDVKSMMDKAEKVRKDLEGDIKSLKKAYAKKSGMAKGMTDVGKTAVEKILGKEFTTISGCRKNLRLFLDKLGGVDVSAHKLAADLQKLLKQTEDANKAHGDLIKANPQLASSMAALEREIDTLIKKIISKEDQVTSGKKWSKDTAVELDRIEEGRPGWTKALERGLIAYDVAMSVKDLDKSVSTIIELTSNIAGAAKDLESEFKSLEAGRA